MSVARGLILLTHTRLDLRRMTLTLNVGHIVGLTASVAYIVLAIRFSFHLSVMLDAGVVQSLGVVVIWTGICHVGVVILLGVTLANPSTIGVGMPPR